MLLLNVGAVASAVTTGTYDRILVSYVGLFIAFHVHDILQL